MLAHVVRACGALHGSLPRACHCECVRYVRAVCAVYVCGARVRCVRCVCSVCAIDAIFFSVGSYTGDTKVN